MKIQFVILVSLIGWYSCSSKKTVFTQVNSNHSGVHFVNEITEYDTFNILNSEFIYNGAGVGIGDLNNDGLEDVFFAGNQVNNTCYLNMGNFKFKDITQAAHLVKPDSGMWSSGVNIIDLNGDGYKDIYVTNTLIRNAQKRKNLFYLHKGIAADGIPQFEESAARWGLDDTSYASHAQFFDFDLDGDLDLFIGTNYIDKPIPGQYYKDVHAVCDQNCDKLYRNDWDSISNEPRYIDISSSAGMTLSGYSHSTLIYDFNEDGWPDIYVANDYQSDDLIYINNKDGSFTNQNFRMFKHQSSAAMGSDLGDINNDRRPEVMTVEMLPFTNLRKKTLIGPGNYSSYIYVKQYGYQYQYTRNTLQYHQGMFQGYPVYSDISFMSNVHETEWSWAPLFADFDLDLYQDLYITNGFPKDVTDHDFGEYRNETRNLIGDMDLQSLIPVVKVSNFMYHNKKDLTFDDKTKEWGLFIKSFSNGAAYGDLDNDGDLDLIVHNIDDAPFIFKNNSIAENQKTNIANFINIKLAGTTKNIDGIGSKIEVYPSGTNPLTRYVMAGRGYLSQSSYISNFGLDSLQVVDSILVYWYDGSIQKIEHPKINTILTIQKNGDKSREWPERTQGLFTAVSPSSIGIDYKHTEKDYIDFNIQKTLPHKFSQYGVPLAIGDINGDGLADVVLGASSFEKERIYYQQPDHSFKADSANWKLPLETRAEDAGLVLIDIENDNDLDIILAGGSYENYNSDKEVFNIRVYINNGTGLFTRDSLAIESSIRTCAGTLKAADIDLDGDEDLFIGGHVRPAFFPEHDKSFVLINESNAQQIKFLNKTKEWIKGPEADAIINDALFTDFNNDQKPDLILAKEWGPITFLKNTGQSFELVSSPSILVQSGWWTALHAADMDNDGDMDYICGNYGENVYFTCTSAEPITVYAKDFDANGALDPFISCYWRDTNGVKKEYFFHGRDEMIKQLISIKRKYQNYTSFGNATVQEVFSEKELEGALKLQTNTLSSVYIRNDGNDRFSSMALPKAAQIAPIFGIQTVDINQDNFLDLLISGNDHGMELIQGMADASQGLVLLNQQGRGFLPMELSKSGFFVPKENRALAHMILNDKWTAIQMVNNESLTILSLPVSGKQVIPGKNETSAVLEWTEGKRKLEFYPTNGFKVQNHRMALIPTGANLIIQNYLTKNTRTIQN